MKMKWMKKLIWVVIVAFGFFNPARVFAADYKTEREKNDFLNEHPYEHYLYQQAQTFTGIMDREKERYLNEQGVFDSELTGLSQTDIEEIEQADEIMVSTEIYAMSDTVEDTSASKNLTYQEKQDLIEELYGDELPKEETLLEKAVQFLKPVPVYADFTRYRVEDESVAYMKKTLLITISSDKPHYAHVQLTCTWLTMPQYRLEDVLFVSFPGTVTLDTMQLVSKQISYDYQDVAMTDKGVEVRSSELKYLDDMEFGYVTKTIDGNKFSVAYLSYQLPSDSPGVISYGNIYKKRCVNVQCILGFYLYSSKKIYINVSGEYIHYEKHYDTSDVANAAASIGACILSLVTVPSGIVSVLGTFVSSATTGYSVYSLKKKLEGTTAGNSVGRGFYIK